MNAVCNPKPKRGLRQPTILLPPTRTPPLKRPPRITLPPIAPLVTGALVFIAGVLYPHPAGPTSEWGVVALPEQDEQRWADLEAKRKKLEREGKALSPAEYEEWLALDQRKFPMNHDNSGNARPRKEEDGTVEKNKLSDAEYQQTLTIADKFGGKIKGQTLSNTPGIDGTRDGKPISLKQYEGTSPMGVLKHVSKAEKQAAKKVLTFT